jgi:hypothetical protein
MQPAGLLQSPAPVAPAPINPNQGIATPPAVSNVPVAQPPTVGASTQPSPGTGVAPAGSAINPAPAAATGANPFTAGQYGAAPATPASAQATANDMGTAAQNLLLGGLNNPNPNAGSPLTSGAATMAQGQLANPNPYNASNVQQEMQVLQQPIVEQQQADIAAQNANAASRGVFDSNINSGALSDINTAAGRQQADIGSQLISQMAGAQQTGENSAISNAAGLQNQQFGQQQSSTAQALNNLLGYSGQSFNQSAVTAQLNQAQQAQQEQFLLAQLGAT